MIILYIFIMSLIISSLGENCDNIKCSHIFDDVCGLAELKDGTQIIMKYKNICYMRKKECELQSFMEINQIADEMCNIKRKWEQPRYDEYQGHSRRVYDFSIVGAHQACNHSCPTFCADTYDPACAQIWKSNMNSYTYRPMINHCHIDLFSCAAGANVTIQPLGKCYKNPSGLLFMQQVAAMKSLRLLDDDPAVHHAKMPHSRRKNSGLPSEEVDISFNNYLKEIVTRIFHKKEPE